jgi:hypothetical protein
LFKVCQMSLRVGRVTLTNGKSNGRSLSEITSWQVDMMQQVPMVGDHSKHYQPNGYASRLRWAAQLLRRVDIKVTVLRVDCVVVYLVRAGKMSK